MATLLRFQFAVLKRRRSFALFMLAFLTSVAALGGYELYYMLHYGYRGFTVLEFSTRYSVLWPSFFLVLTYELLSLPGQCHMDESVDAHRATSHRHRLAALAVPTAVLIAAFCVYLLLRLTVVFASSMAGLLLWHVISAAILDILAPSVIAILLGLLLARKAERFAGYAAIVAFVFVIGPYSEIVPHVFSAATFDAALQVNVYPVFDLFRILAPDQTWSVSPLYGFPLEFQRWAVAGFWIAGLSGLSLPFVLRSTWRGAEYASASLLLIAALLFSAALMPSSTLRRDLRPDATDMADMSYYDRLGTEPPEQLDVRPGFRVAAYDMRFSADRALDAVVSVDLADDAHGDAYRFTLYHGYKITSVSDSQGNALTYSRDGDYVTVRSTAVHERITFRYRGDGGARIANYQCVFLPGYFPYYPIAGFVPLWDRQTHRLIETRRTDGVPADFSVEFDAHVPVTSNLPETGGRFVGRSYAPTFVGGLIARQEILGHGVVFYPAGSWPAQFFEAEIASLRSFERRVGVSRSVLSSGAAVFAPPGLGGDQTAVLPDTLFIASGGFDLLLVGAPPKDNRGLLVQAFRDLLIDPQGLRERCSALPEPRKDEVAKLERLSRSGDNETLQLYDSSAYDVVYRLFYDKVLREGEDAVLKETYAYLMSQDPSSEIGFLTSGTRKVEP